MGQVSVADLMAGANKLNAQAQDASTALLADNATIQGNAADSQDAILNSGDLSAIDAANKTAAQFVTQQNKRALAEAAGVTDGAGILVDTASRMTSAYYDKQDKLDQIRQIQTQGIQDDPLQYIVDQFKTLPDLKKAYNLSSDDFALNQHANASINAALQSGNKSYDDITASLDAGSAGRAADLALNAAQVNANNVSSQAAQLNSQAIERVYGLSKDELQRNIQINQAQNSDRQFGLEQQRFQLQKKEFDQRVQDHLEAVAAKKESSLSDSQLLDWYNTGLKQIAPSAAPVDGITLKNLLRLQPQLAQNTITSGMQLEANPGMQIPFSSNTLSSLDYISKMRGDVSGSRKGVADWVTTELSTASQNPKSPFFGKKFTDPNVVASFQSYIQGEAQKSQATLVGATNGGTPYELPGIGIGLKSKDLVGSQFAQVFAPIAADPANKVFNPQIQMATLAEAVSKGQLNINDAAQGMATAVQTMILTNNAAKQFKTVNLPEQTVAGAYLPLPDRTNLGIGGGDERTAKPVNMADPAQVSAYLVKYLAAKSASQLPSSGRIFD